MQYDSLSQSINKYHKNYHIVEREKYAINLHFQNPEAWKTSQNIRDTCDIIENIKLIIDGTAKYGNNESTEFKVVTRE